MQSSLLVQIGAAAVLAGAGMAPWYASEQRAEAADTTVRIAGFAFAPANASVNAGDTVTWAHEDGDIPHSVAFTGGPSSPVLTGGGFYLRTFESAGTYGYICGVHPSMTGTVTVAAAQEPTAAPTAVPPTPTSPPAATSTAPPATATATSTPTAAARATEEATATQATESATPTPTPRGTGTAAPTSSAGATSTATPNATPNATPMVPDAGDGDDGSSPLVPIVLGSAAVVLIGAGAGFALWRRNAR